LKNQGNRFKRWTRLAPNKTHMHYVIM